MPSLDRWCDRLKPITGVAADTGRQLCAETSEHLLVLLVSCRRRVRRARDPLAGARGAPHRHRGCALGQCLGLDVRLHIVAVEIGPVSLIERRSARRMAIARSPRARIKPLKSLGAGEGNRTLVFSLEGCCSTIELHPRQGLPNTAGRRSQLLPGPLSPAFRRFPASRTGGGSAPRRRPLTCGAFRPILMSPAINERR